MLSEIQQIQQQAECLFSPQQLEQALDQMAHDINLSMAELNPLVLCVINGGIIVTGKLLPRLSFPLNLDSVQATRYRNQTSGSDVQWLLKPTTDLTNRHVLIVDDILDEGHTLVAIVDWCLAQGASSVKTAVLLDKNLGKTKPIQADFVGLQCENRYLFGYGLDYKGYLRNANGVFACKDVL